MQGVSERAREKRVRQLLAKKGYGLVKSRARRDDNPEKGLYAVFSYTDRMAVTRGYHPHSETLEQVEKLAAEIKADPAWQ